MRIAVLGMGSWGSALAVRLGRKQHDLSAWTHDPAQRAALVRDGENRKYLPGVALPPLDMKATPEEAVRGAEIVLLAVPSFAVREVAGSLRDVRDTTVVNAAKGLEPRTHLRLLDVLAEEVSLPSVSLLGPSHAEEVAADHPTAVVATSRSAEAARCVQDVFSDETFRIYTNDDVIGVELASALKNVIALAAGIAGGLGFGDNTAGALLTRGLAEMTRLGVSQGARPETFFGLAGVGDLVTTCLSRHSRNRRVGEALGRGSSLDEVLAGMSMVAEGVPTTRAARDLAREAGVEMPIVERVHAVLFEGEPAPEGIRLLMTREPKAEEPIGHRGES